MNMRTYLPTAEDQSSSYGREPLFLPTFRQRKENPFFLPPAENRNLPFSPLPGEGREPDTMFTEPVFLPSAENRNLPFSPLHGDGREPVFLRQRTNLLPTTENRSSFQPFGKGKRTPSSFLWQRTATFLFHHSPKKNLIGGPPTNSIHTEGTSSSQHATLSQSSPPLPTPNGLMAVVRRTVGPSGGGPVNCRAFKWWSGGVPAVVEEEQGGQSGLRSLPWSLQALALRSPFSSCTYILTIQAGFGSSVIITDNCMVYLVVYPDISSKGL
ncbi:hypothetical protein M5K25_004721 [Dendrobium thyrsiflorum]|uniref:Uncharacterized protein n=1 Tax=Dendrobium thyrsiflorum TaxID=117978 RepID=A0ABD0VGR9_DENTH